MPAPIVHVSAIDRIAVRLVYWTRARRSSPFRQVLRLVGIDIPPQVRIGRNLTLPHVGAGHTIHWNTTIGHNVIINCGVVIGRGDLWGKANPAPEFHIGNDVVIGANAVIMGRSGVPLTLGEGSMVGAGSVLTKSIGPGEIWAGNPAVFRRAKTPVVDEAVS